MRSEDSVIGFKKNRGLVPSLKSLGLGKGPRNYEDRGPDLEIRQIVRNSSFFLNTNERAASEKARVGL